VLLRDDGTFRVTDVIALKNRDGHPLSGLLNPLKTAETDTGRTEGRALLGDGALVLISDDDFGIEGGRTQIVVAGGHRDRAPLNRRAISRLRTRRIGVTQP
jgi:hypothetical protein